MFDNMKLHTNQVQDEVLQLKDTYRESSEHIINEVEKVSSHMIRDFTTHQTNLTLLNDTTQTHGNRL